LRKYRIAAGQREIIIRMRGELRCEARTVLDAVFNRWNGCQGLYRKMEVYGLPPMDQKRVSYRAKRG
jgi:hypothetical protein